MLVPGILILALIQHTVCFLSNGSELTTQILWVKIYTRSWSIMHGENLALRSSQLLMTPCVERTTSPPLPKGQNWTRPSPRLPPCWNTIKRVAPTSSSHFSGQIICHRSPPARCMSADKAKILYSQKQHVNTSSYALCKQQPNLNGNHIYPTFRNPGHYFMSPSCLHGRHKNTLKPQ